MKVYVIHNKEINGTKIHGYLFCYEKAGKYIIELCDDLDEWEAPLLFQKFVSEGKYTIPANVAKLWVEERVIPSGRQNIGSILKRAKLTEYNELALLDLSKGRCSQDACYLEEIKFWDVPDNIVKRAYKNVYECYVTDNQCIVCMFRDNFLQKISLQKLALEYNELNSFLKNKELLGGVKIGVGGYSILFNESIDIPVDVLRDAKYAVSLEATDFTAFVNNNVVDTTGACEILQCSRQNISYLVKVGKLEPIKNGTKENMFTRGSVERIVAE